MASEFLQLVGCDIPHAVNSCVFLADDLRVLFNCPEGAQRFASEASLRVSKFSTFFYTRISAASFMGTPGFLFTVNDCGVKRVVLGGPPVDMQNHHHHGISTQECREVSSSAARTEDHERSYISSLGLIGAIATLQQTYFTYRTMMFDIVRPAAAPSCCVNAVQKSAPVIHAPFVDDIFLRIEGGSPNAASNSAASDPTLCTFGGSLASSGASSLNHPNPASSSSSCLSSGQTLRLGQLWHCRVLTINTLLLSFLTAADVVSYALLTVTRKVFHADAAKACGLKPGAKYTQLKQGIAVLNDEDPPRLVQPDEVLRYPGGRTTPEVAISFLLDANDVSSLAEALNTFCADMGVALQQQGQHQCNTAPCDNEAVVPGTWCGLTDVVQDFLTNPNPTNYNRSTAPTLGQKESDNGAQQQQEESRSTPPNPNRNGTVEVSIPQVLHLGEETLCGSASYHSAFVKSSSYWEQLRDHMQNPTMNLNQTETEAAPMSSSVPAPPTRSVSPTRHFVPWELKHDFTAFPTSLVHRYHLAALAPAYFPVPVVGRAPSAVSSSTHGDSNPAALSSRRKRFMTREGSSSLSTTCEPNDDSGSGVSSLWPYSVRHRLAPNSWATGRVVVPTTQSKPQATSSAAKGKSSSSSASQTTPQEAAVLVKYPTPSSAMEMLSQQFRDTHWPTLPDDVVSGAELGTSSREADSVVVQRMENQRRQQEVGPSLEAEGGSILFLGTGSSVPSKYRNVTGMLVVLPGGLHEDESEKEPRINKKLPNAVVLDFGEGSLGQLYSFCRHRPYEGRDGGGEQHGETATLAVFEQWLRSVTMISISHSHADHNLGLIALMEGIRRSRTTTAAAAEVEEEGGTMDRRSPVVVVAPNDFTLFTLQLIRIFYPTVFASFPNTAQDAATPRGTGAVVDDPPPAATATAADNRHLSSSSFPLQSAVEAYFGVVFDTFSHEGPMESACSVFKQQRATAAASPQQQQATYHQPRGGVCRVAHTPHLFSWAARHHCRAEMFPVDHPAHAHGIVIQVRPSPQPHINNNTKKSFSILYSGDTRPCVNVIEKGRQCAPLTVLLHEATFDDSLAEEAVWKRHSTISEAVSVGRQCHAQNILLTHFSQRYPKMIQTGSSASSTAAPTSATTSHPTDTTTTAAAGGGGGGGPSSLGYVFSFDFMRVPFDWLDALSVHHSQFESLLEEYDQWESGTSRRLRVNN